MLHSKVKSKTPLKLFVTLAKLGSFEQETSILLRVKEFPKLRKFEKELRKLCKNQRKQGISLALNLKKVEIVSCPKILEKLDFFNNYLGIWGFIYLWKERAFEFIEPRVLVKFYKALKENGYLE